MQCILSRWFGHWRTESRQGAAPPPATAPEAVVDNLRRHQRRLSWHHGNSRPYVDVLPVEIFTKANLPLAQIPPQQWLRNKMQPAGHPVVVKYQLFSNLLLARSGCLININHKNSNQILIKFWLCWWKMYTFISWWAVYFSSRKLYSKCLGPITRSGEPEFVLNPFFIISGEIIHLMHKRLHYMQNAVKG